jgi:hypothetical protein
MSPDDDDGKSRDSSVGIAMGEGLRGQNSIPIRGQESFLYSTTSRPALGPTQPPTQRLPTAFPRR